MCCINLTKFVARPNAVVPLAFRTSRIVQTLSKLLL